MNDPAAELAGAAGKQFTSAACVILQDGRELLAAGAGGADPDRKFDVASLTKILVTTPVVLDLVRKGQVELDGPIGRRLAGAAARAATPRHLLAHSAGLPAWRPLFEEGDASRLFAAGALSGAPADVAERFRRGREAVVQAALSVAPSAPPGERALYSDIGFMVLGAMAELAGGARLDALFRDRVAAPLGLDARFLDFTTAPEAQLEAAPTGRLRPRPGNPPGGTLEPTDTGGDPLPDDDHAYAMGGVSAHAGLFASARETARAGEALRRAAEGDDAWLDPALARECFRPQGPAGSTRTLGMDTPSPQGSQAGMRLGRGPRGAAGHTGFTGCSLWIDLDRRAVIALCTDAVSVARPNIAFRDWRPRWHDSVATRVLSSAP